MHRAAVYTVVALTAAASGYALFHYGIAPRLTAQKEAPTPAAAATASATAPSEETLDLPAQLPDVSMEDAKGEVRSISSWTGKSMIVNFWATWCAPCRREIPLLKQIQEQQAPQGVQVVGIAIDSRELVLKYASEIGINYPLLIGEEGGIQAASQLGQGSLALPFTAFTDQQHRIVATHAGELTKPQADVLLGVIERLNKGELTLEAARTLADQQLQALEG
jgi:thiol-disulfide isomerase/thioredoxin